MVGGDGEPGGDGAGGEPGADERVQVAGGNSCTLLTRSDLATFTSRLRKHAILEPVTAAICQLEDNGTPIDYARRRRLPRLAQAQLDVTASATSPATWGQPR